MAVGAVLLLLAVAGGPPAAAAAARPAHANASASWEDLFEETAPSVQSHWLLPWSGSPVKTLPGALPEYYGATAHPVLPPDGDESPLTLVLRASAALRDNMATVFGYFLHLPANALDAELYSALRLLHELVRLRRVRAAALVAAVPEMADAPPRRQWRALLGRMRRAAPRWAAGAVAEWADALEARRVDVEGVMRPRGGALKVDFLAGFDRPAVQRLGALQVESYYNAESIASEGDGTSSGGDKFMDRVFDALRDRSLRFSQCLFGLLLSYRPRNVILPDKEESERHLVAILLNSQLDGWDRLSWSFEDEHLQYLHDFIRLVLSTLLQSGDLKPQTRGLVREVLEYVEIPKPTFSNFYFEQLASILTEPSLDILKFIENIVIGEYPNEIINLRRRLESYFRNGFLNVDLALQGFNRFDYSTPNDILVAFLTRLNRQFPNLPHDISSTIGHLKQHINFKSSKQKLLPVLNSDVIDMFHVFESYYVADEIVLASLKLKAQLQLEDNDFSEIIKMVRPDECGQPRSCIHTILKVALKSNVLRGKKSKELIKDFLDLLDENGEPVHFLHVYNDFQKKDNDLNIPRTQPLFPRNRQARIYCSGKDYCTGVLRHNNVRKYKKKIGNNSGNDSIEKGSPFPDSSSVNIADSTAPGSKRLRARKRGSKRIRPNTTRSGQKEKVTSETVLGSNLTSVLLSSTTSNPITSWEFNASEIFTTPTFPQSSSKSKTIKNLTSTTVSTMSTGTLRTRKRRQPRPTPSRFPITSTTLTVTPHYEYNKKEHTTVPVASRRRKRDVAWKVNEGSTERPVEDAWPATRESSEITTTENAAELHPNTFITTSPLKKITTKSDSRFSTPDTVKLNSVKSDYTETHRNSSYDTQRRAVNTAEKRHRKATKDSIEERREHKHFKNSIRPIISASVEQTDSEYTDESDDVSQEEYHPTKVRSPMRFEGVERKSHRIPQRKGTHRRRKGHVIASTKRNTKRKGMKYREHGLAVESSYEDDLPRYHIEEFDSHSRERSCETDEDGNCVDYSDSREDKSDASEEDEPLLNSGGETQNEGSGNAMDTNRDFGAKDSTSTTPRPLHLSTAQTKERFKMITREWSKKSRKQRKQHKHGVRAVGHLPLDVSSHHGDHPTHGDPFEPLELPLLHGRKPIRYKIIIMKRNRKHRSKRLRRRRKKIPKGIFQPRHINHFSDDDGGGDYERNNSTGRQISSVGSSEERNHEDDSHGQTEEDDTEYELCSESGEDYPKCADDGNTSGEESHSHYDEDVVIVKPARARGLQDSHEDSGERYDDDDDLDDSSYEDSAEAVVEYDDHHADHYGSRSREFPEIGLSSRSLGGSLDALDDWKRRLARGWEPPKFTLICPTREQTVCPDPSPPPPVLYTAVSQVEWTANWTYFSDPLEVSRLSQPSLRQLASGARALRLRGRPALSAREAALAEALLAALAADYARGASTPQPGAGAAGQRRAARRALAGAWARAGAALPVPGEAAERQPANARRLDALLPPTAPGSLADVRLRPLRLFLAPLRAPRRAPAPARKGPLLRWALRELVLAERRAAADPLLALPARQLLRTWGARRGSRPRAEVAAWSLADALPPAGAGAEGAEAVEAARALLTRPEWRAAAEAAALEEEGEEEEGGAVTKAQLLRRVLLRASQQGHAHALAPLLAEAAARWVVAEGLGAQAPARTLAAGLRVDLRALLRRHLRAARVLADAGATAALRTLLRAAADGSLAFRRVDAARCRTSAQLLRALLRHLAGDGANPTAAAAAAQLLPFVLETHLPLPPLAFE